MTVEAVFVYPDHCEHEFCAGTVKAGPTKVVPPVPKPPATEMQKDPPPGKVCAEANVMTPLLLIFNPVSAGLAEPVPKSRFNVADGLAVSLLNGSACQWKT